MIWGVIISAVVGLLGALVSAFLSPDKEAEYDDFEETYDTSSVDLSFPNDLSTDSDLALSSVGSGLWNGYGDGVAGSFGADSSLGLFSTLATSGLLGGSGSIAPLAVGLLALSGASSNSDDIVTPSGQVITDPDDLKEMKEPRQLMLDNQLRMNPKWEYKNV